MYVTKDKRIDCYNIACSEREALSLLDVLSAFIDLVKDKGTTEHIVDERAIERAKQLRKELTKAVLQ